MDDALRVSVVERAADLGGDGKSPVDRHGRPHAGAQRLALDVLHHKVGHALLLAEVQHRHDVRMVEPRDEPGLLLEAADEARIQGSGRKQDLDRDVALESQLMGLVDDGHSSLAQLGDDAVAGPHPAGEVRYL